MEQDPIDEAGSRNMPMIQQCEEGEENSDDDQVVINEDEATGQKRKRAHQNHREMRKKTPGLPPSVKDKIKLNKGDEIWVELEGEQVRAKILSRDKVSGSFYNYFNIKDGRGLQWNINLEQAEWRQPQPQEECMMVMIPRHRHGEKDCRDAKKVELEKLKQFDTISEVEDSGQFRISSTWVMWVKEHSGGNSEVRARLVARGYEEQEEVISDSPTIDQVNIKLMLAMAASKRWRVVSSDVKSAFLQGKQIAREVIMKPPPEANAKPGTLWKLNVALYGLDDASLQFHFKCKEVFEKLGLKQSKLDPTLFYEHNEKGELIGMLGTHVDDFLKAGTDDWLEKINFKLGEAFQMGRVEDQNFKYVGYRIKQDAVTKEITMDQEEFAEKIEMIKIDPGRAKQKEESLEDEEKTLMRGISGKLGWIGRGTRPDLLFHQVECSTKFLSGKVEDMKRAARAMRNVQAHKSCISYKSLGEEAGWSVELATDASWQNLNGTDSTEAGLVMIRGGDRVAPVLWWSNKIKRVCRSAMEAETMSLNTGIDQAIYVKQVMEELLAKPEDTIPLRAMVDNQDCHSIAHANCAAKERRLRAEVSRIKEALRRGQISELVLVKGPKQLANAMTKRTADPTELLRIFQTGERHYEENEKKQCQQK